MSKLRTGNRARGLILILTGLIIAMDFQEAACQSVPLSIKEVLQRVRTNLPKLEALRQQASATQENIQLAKNSMVPDLNIGYQVNLATYNNITGMSYPGFLLPISGPPSVSNDLNFVPGTAAGALLKWNPITFGQRNAAIEKATAQFKQANAAYNEDLFQSEYNAINIYLESVYYKQLMKSVQASIDRNKVGLEQALVLAINGLRQGMDTVQFYSAIAQGEIEFLQSERVYQGRLIELSRLTAMNSSAEDILLTDTLFNPTINLLVDTSTIITSHPHFQSLEAQKNITAAGLREIERSWVPQLDIWGNLYARGSGIDAYGQVNKSDGFNLSRTNAGIGVQLSFPVFQLTKMNIKKKQYESLLKADEARLVQVQLDITKETANALQQYRQDVKIANKSPVLLKAATDVYEGLKLSYDAGLIDYTRLAQAQYELLNAEVNYANSRLQVWRSLLAVAVAKGNLDLFTDQLK